MNALVKEQDFHHISLEYQVKHIVVWFGDDEPVSSEPEEGMKSRNRRPSAGSG